jgi:predicted Zn-dependent peptidase
MSGFYIVWEGSTNLEKPGWYGISHLCEHLICKSFDHLQEDFDRDGVDWNMYTSDNEIVGYMTGLDSKIEKWKHEFIKLLSEFKITKEQFENERKIVIEEYEDSMNSQSEVHGINLSRKLFNDFGPIGLRKDLEKLKFLDIINYWELQYSNPSKIINVSKGKPYKNGNIEFKSNKITRKLEYGKHKVDLELKNEFKDKSSVIVLSPVIESDFGIVHFINAMLSLGLKSPLYQEVREKEGLVYYINCYLSRINTQGINTISTQTSNSNVKKVMKAIEKVISNPGKFLTKERFELVRDYYKVRREKDEILRYKNVNQQISPKGWSVYEILDTITLKDIKKVYAKYYNFEDFYISNDKTEFKK